MVPDVTVFNTAWLIEKDMSEFYATMAQNTEGKAKEALTMLSEWEKGHEIFFREYRDTLSETYSKMPWGG
jgi:rubrerythrin